MSSTNNFLNNSKSILKNVVNKGSDCTFEKPKCKPNYTEDEQQITRAFLKKHKQCGHTLTGDDLETGFGMHKLSSLEFAIAQHRKQPYICKCLECMMKAYSDTVEEASSRSSQTSTIIADHTYTTNAQNRLHYLMGLRNEGEEEDEEEDGGGPERVIEPECTIELINGGSEAMRKAQRYLREHKIFEFFQFLIAHLLAATPYPIAFLINLLEKCLIYRSGMCNPPLLYDLRHIGCLFNLMDRMRTEFIDFQQYKTGMLTLGIKSFNQKPPMTHEGYVTKNYFCEEAYECLKDLLNDMIRVRRKVCKGKSKKLPKAPPPSTVLL